MNLLEEVNNESNRTQKGVQWHQTFQCVRIKSVRRISRVIASPQHLMNTSLIAISSLIKKGFVNTMKITIEHEGRIVSVNEPDAVSVDEAIELFRDALLALGYQQESIDKYLDLT